ncbi:Hypothetical protein Mbur_2167 [Methanococcoides burtonii DSM 6242]|uniref:Uncharacterized protein n=2 Tax=Methanococcoides burtonii TaxID=29291 RepID=Q12U40_METBU|nr:Hypothetical protein Mbur_2167 [Methanococcoides burtonii DSM 6242]
MFRCTICIVLVIFCMGCIENEQEVSVEDITSEEDILFINNNYKELDEAGDMASYICQMEVMDYYSQPNVAYVFDEEVFYMNESERAKVEYTEAIIHFNRTPIHFIDLNKIEEFGELNYSRSHLNSIVSSAFTPMYGVDGEQLNCIIYSRNILLNHCMSKEHEDRLRGAFKIIDTWAKFRDSMIQANVPMNRSDANRTFVLDNVEDMNVIMDLNWKQADLEQYFDFLDTSGFNSSNDLLMFARQFRIAKKCIDDKASNSERNKIYEAREYVIANFPLYSDAGIQKSDIKVYFYRCDNKS